MLVFENYEENLRKKLRKLRRNLGNVGKFRKSGASRASGYIGVLDDVDVTVARGQVQAGGSLVVEIVELGRGVDQRLNTRRVQQQLDHLPTSHTAHRSSQ